MSIENELALQYSGDVKDIYSVETLIKNRVGNMCYVSSMPESNEDFIRFGIITDEVIMDTTKEKPRIRLVCHDNVFRGYFDDNSFGKVIVLPNKLEICKDMDKYMSRSTESFETNMLGSIGSRALKIVGVQNQMTPILSTIRSVISFDKVSIKDLRWKKEKFDRYIGFLENLDIIKVEDGNLYPGKVMSKYMDEDASDDDAYETVVNEVINRGLITLMYSLNMTHLQFNMKLSNANYMTSYLADSKLKWDIVSYQYYMKKIYKDKFTSMRIFNDVSNLSDAKILAKEKYKGNHVFYCEDEIFREYSDKCKQTTLF